MKEKRQSIEAWSKGIAIVASVLLIAFLAIFAVIDRVDVYSARGVRSELVRADYNYREVESESAPIGVVREYSFSVDDPLSYDCYLSFFTSHHFVRVYIDGELVYSLGLSDSDLVGGTVGTDWISIPLDHGDEGKEVRIELSPIYKNVDDFEHEFLFGERIALVRYQLLSDMPQLILSILAILLGLFFTFFALVALPRQDIGFKVLWLGLFSLLLGVWRLMDNRSIALLNTRLNELVYLMIVTMMMFSFQPITRFLYDRRKWRSALIYDSYLIFSSLSIVAVVLLQAWDVFDFREMYLIPYIVMFGGAFVVFAVGIIERFVTHTSNKSFFYFGFEFICCGGALLDLTLYYTQSSSTNLNVTLICFDFYIFVSGIYLVTEYIEKERLLKENEKQLADARASVVLSQIQPHFLFNTLTSIAGLCELDPKMARDVTIDFSHYLRGNLNSLTNRGLISFDAELEHTRCYLNIESARFGDRIRVEYDIGYTAFFLPPLTLQPLVENAVRHGITKREEGGRVRISTYTDDDFIYLTVSDDGVGYNFYELYGSADGGSHVGLANVRTRLESMLGATLDVESNEGAGTTAIVKIYNSERGKAI